MRSFKLASCLVLAASLACGSDTDTSVSTASTTTVTASSTGPDATTGDATGFVTTGADEPTTGGQGATGSTGGASDPTTGAPDETTTFGTDTATSSTTAMTTTLTTTGEPGSTGDTSEVVDCASLKADYAAELAKIRSCDDAEQCGQELMGTSCGCTHNLIARLDADSSDLYAILKLADEHGCELVLAGTCDCPAAEGFVCSDGLCGWNYL